MIKSMTGYGKSLVEIPGKNITIEIKALNSKQVDIYAKIPGFYKEKELNIRNIVASELVRGKIEFLLYCEITNADKSPTLNKQVFENYYTQIKDIADNLNIETDPNIFQTILRLPDTLKVERENLDEAEWKAIEQGVHKAIKDLNEFRTQEGAALYKDFVKRIDIITELSEKVIEFEPERIETLKAKLEQAFKDNVTDASVDKNRFEQELIYYFEKLDITEEKVRLKNHCEYFLEVLNSNESNGKKLGFISQEIGREINTMGSKANHPEIQKLVVQMKDELEKIKEQVLNIL